jgi:4-carboxymuconolactone decarboxylase
MKTTSRVNAVSDSIRSDIQRDLGAVNPKLASLTTDVLYADIWERPQLSKRDRSLITVAALMTKGQPEELRIHLEFARKNGVSKEELIEAITHLAFYAGWPNAVSATRIAEDVFAA